VILQDWFVLSVAILAALTAVVSTMTRERKQD
jgi:hypothetical protein